MIRIVRKIPNAALTSLVMLLIGTIWVLLNDRISRVEQDVASIRSEFRDMHRSTLEFYSWQARREGAPSVAEKFEKKLEHLPQ